MNEIRFFRITAVREGARGTVLEGDDALLSGAIIDPARFAGVPARLQLPGAAEAHVACAQLDVLDQSGVRRLVFELETRIPNARPGGTVWIDGALLAPPRGPSSSAPPPNIAAVHIVEEQAAQRGLPPVGLHLSTAGSGMAATMFPMPGWYVRAAAPPGVTLLFDVLATTDHAEHVAIERAMREVFRDAWAQPIATYVHGRMVLAGAERNAVALTTGNGPSRLAWLGTIIRAARGSVLVLIGGNAPYGQPTIDEMLGHPQLAPLVRSFGIDNAV